MPDRKVTLDDGTELTFSAITIEQAENMPDQSKPIALLLVGLSRRHPEMTETRLKQLLTLDKLQDCLTAFTEANGGAFKQGEVLASQ